MDRFWEGTDNMYPTAGNPWIGILTLITTVVVIYKVGFDNNDRCCSVGYELSLLSLLVILVFVFGWSFCERAGERLCGSTQEGVRQPRCESM